MQITFTDIEWVRGSSNSSNNSVSEDEAEVEVVADEAFGKFVKTSKIKISSEAFKSGENQIVCKATTTYGSDELKFVITKGDYVITIVIIMTMLKLENLKPEFQLQNHKFVDT